jgi:hypothetical protein
MRTLQQIRLTNPVSAAQMTTGTLLGVGGSADGVTTLGDAAQIIGLMPKGAWSGATAYVAGDAVTSNGSSYRCKLAHTNQAPPNVTYWDLLASKGDTGATGAQGIQGATGAQGPAGATGSSGANGATWYSGSSAPSDGSGVNGDYYFRTSNADVYLKTAGSWSISFNLAAITLANGAESTANKDQPNGYAGLNADKQLVGPILLQGYADAAAVTAAIGTPPLNYLLVVGGKLHLGDNATAAGNPVSETPLPDAKIINETNTLVELDPNSTSATIHTTLGASDISIAFTNLDDMPVGYAIHGMVVQTGSATTVDFGELGVVSTGGNAAFYTIRKFKDGSFGTNLCYLFAY